MITIHVTDLDQLNWYRKLENMTTEDLKNRLLRKSEPAEKMLIGTAWHAILENPPAEIDDIESNGFRFKIGCEAEVSIPQVREIRATKVYNVDGLQVMLTGGCDGITGNKIKDHKLSFNPNPESYFDSFQWRAYLDIYGADVFEYYLYHAVEGNGETLIKGVDSFKMYRYPGMENDLEAGIHDLLEFFKEHLPERITA